MPETPQLDELDASNELGFLALHRLLTSACALERAAIDILDELDLTAGAYFALLEIERSGEAGLSPSELSRKIAVARRTATLYIDILTKHGWVERTPHPEDRRMVLARLSPQGADLLHAQGRALKERLGGLLDPLSPLQAERLRQLLDLVPCTPCSE